jgi:hypothetical protein
MLCAPCIASDADMSKTGGWAKKLADKSNAKATALRMGTHRAIVTRTNSTFAEKQVAFLAHKRLITVHAINPGCRVTDLTKDGKKRGVTFRGDGLADDCLAALKPSKTNAERAKEDKRNRLKDEMVPGWRPSRYVREDDVVSAALRLVRG